MKINDYPKHIEQAALDLASLNLELAEVREQIKIAEIETLATVIDARGENDKPLYSNDRARDVAIYFILRADSAYNQDKSTERILERKKASLEAECERLRREYRIALIDYEKAELGKREAA